MAVKREGKKGRESNGGMAREDGEITCSHFAG